MSGEDPGSSRIRRMLPSVSEVLKELTARAPIEPNVAFRVAREVCAEELKRIRDAGGESVPLEVLVQRAIERATRVATSPSVVAPAPVAPHPLPRREPAPSVEDPFSETTGAMDLRWDRDAREPFTEPQAVVPPPAGGLVPGGETAVEIPVLPIPPDEGPSSTEPRPVRPADAERGEDFGDETLGRLSREAESIDLREVFAQDAQQAPISFPSPVDDALPVAPIGEPEPPPFEDDEDTVLTIPRGGRSGSGEDRGPRVGFIVGAILGLAALAGLGYLLAGLWMERDAVAPPVVVARPRVEASPRPVPTVPLVATPAVQPSPAAVQPIATVPAAAPTAGPTLGPAPAFRPVTTIAPVPTPRPTVPSLTSPPVRQSRGGLVVTKDRSGRPQVFSIHFTSYQDRTTAERDLRRVSAAVGLEGYVAEVELGERGTWQRVMIGTFDTAEEAKAVRAELAGKGTRDMGLVYRVVGPEAPDRP